MGCVDAVKTETISHIDDAKNLYVKVYKMREELIASIFSAEEQVMLVDLPIASGVKSEVKSLFKLQNEILDYLENVSDFGTGTVQNRIQDFALNIDAISDKDGILMEGEIQVLFNEMKQRMLSVMRKMPDAETRARFTGRLIMFQ